MPLTVADLHATLHDLFHDEAEHLARETGFCRRKRRLTGPVFAQAVVFTLLQTPKPTLEDYADFALDHLAVKVTPNAFDQRFTPAAADFLRDLFCAALERSFDHVRPATLPVLRRFAGVYLRDATLVHLPAALADAFPGRAGKTGKPTAAVKLVLELEVSTGQFTGVSILAATTNDKLADVASAPLPAGALVLEDLGFFAGARLQEYIDQGVYVLSRVPATTVFFDEQGDRIDLPAWLEQAGGSYLERPVRILNDAQAPVRLLAVRLPDEVAKARREQILKEAKKRGRPVNRAKLALSAWHVLVSNAPAELISVYEAWTLRPVRWQIELVFKLFKSEGGLERTQGRTRDRVVAELFGKLLALVVQQWSLLAAGYVMLRHSARRLSRRVRKLAGALVEALASVEALARQIGKLTRRLQRCRIAPKPGDPSTFERLAQHDYDFRMLDLLGLT